jgi:hypothetical protein
MIFLRSFFKDSKPAPKAPTPLDSLQSIQNEQIESSILTEKPDDSISDSNFSSVSKRDAFSSIPPANDSDALARMLASKFKSYNATSESLADNASTDQDSQRAEPRNALPQASSKRAIELVGGAGHLIHVIQAEATSAAEATETRRRQRQEYDRWKDAVINKHRKLENEVVLSEAVY